MRIDESYPKPIDLKRNELKTLEFLRNNSFVNSNFMPLALTANDIYESLRDPKRLENLSFDFESYFELPFDGNEFRFHFGVIINSKKIGTVKRKNQYEYSMVSYYIGICVKESGKFKLIRKFHFDYDVNGNINNHPIFHMQYQGKLSPKLSEHQYDDEHLEPWLSEPRIHHHPVTLALLLNLIFKEFNNEKTHRMLEDSYWKGFIRDNEDLVLTDYFLQCNDFLKKRKKSSSLFTKDFCYGK